MHVQRGVGLVAASCRVWRQTCLGKGVWGAVPVGGSDECKAADVGSWWQPVAHVAGAAGG